LIYLHLLIRFEKIINPNEEMINVHGSHVTCLIISAPACWWRNFTSGYQRRQFSTSRHITNAMQAF